MNRIFFFFARFQMSTIVPHIFHHVHKSKKNYSGNFFQENAKNAKQSWNKTNKVLNNKNLTIGKKSFDNILISGNGRIITDSKIVAA